MTKLLSNISKIPNSELNEKQITLKTQLDQFRRPIEERLLISQGIKKQSNTASTTDNCEKDTDPSTRQVWRNQGLRELITKYLQDEDTNFVEQDTKFVEQVEKSKEVSNQKLGPGY